MIFKTSDKKKVINFFFPLYPMKLTQCTWAISLLAILIAIRIVLQFTSIPIPQFGMTLSIAHTPLMVIGWLFGPVIGLFTGALTDTICFFAKPGGVWYWMYAIQEPMLGCISGIIGSIYLIRKDKQSHKFDFILFQVFFILFIGLCLLFIFNFATPDNKWTKEGMNAQEFYTIYRYIFVAVLLLFGIVAEFFVMIWFHKKKDGQGRLIIYSTLLCFINSVVFSFIMGTLSWVGYWEYIGQPKTAFLKYGYMFYLIPRVVKESLKMPLQAIILWGTLFIAIPLFKDRINYASLTWDYQVKKHKVSSIIWI